MTTSFTGKSKPFRVLSIGFLTGLAVLLTFTSKPAIRMNSSHKLLCLGDSYTIGESVLSSENFPYQTLQLLKKSQIDFEDPEIVAKTGWTTDELQSAINQQTLQPIYDFVTLLIGVNNQYRGLSIDDYRAEFEGLLRQAIRFAGGIANHVIVLSIPDWGVTPYAKSTGRMSSEIAKEIDEFNECNSKIAQKYAVNYIDITPETRRADNDSSLLAADGLHPSCKEYSKWASRVARVIELQLGGR